MVVLPGECGQHSVVETAVGVCLSALERGGAVGEWPQVDLDTINNRIKGMKQKGRSATMNL